MDWSMGDLNKNKSTCTDFPKTSSLQPLTHYMDSHSQILEKPWCINSKNRCFRWPLKTRDYQGPRYIHPSEIHWLSITTNFNSFPNFQVRVRQWRWYQAMGGWLWRSLATFSSTSIWVSWYVFLTSNTNLRHVVFWFFKCFFDTFLKLLLSSLQWMPGGIRGWVLV